MHTPRSFHVDDKEQIAAFIRQFSFCTLTTPTNDGLAISHVPLVLDSRDQQWVLRGHVARVNPHWRALPLASSTAIFLGPHSYISPAWYVETGEVPTWNYTAVHVVGTATVIEDPVRLGQLVDEMVAYYEPLYGSPWDRKLESGYRNRQLEHIVGFEVPVDSVRAKFKLGQNRSAADQQSMQEHLAKTTSPDSLALADFLQKRSGR